MNIRLIQKKYGFYFKSFLGQNFFNNDSMLIEIINRLDIKNTDVILEIGAGFGVLTEKLLDISKKVISIEIDPNAVYILSNEFKDRGNFLLIEGDFLKIDLNNIRELDCPVKIVANIPYYITTPILEKLFKSNLNIDFIAVMIQKEVGDRILALPSSKDYGSLTVFSNYFSTPKLIKNIPACNFTPKPKVDSMFIKFEIKKNRDFKDAYLETKFLDFVKKCFSMRRKNLYNNLCQFEKSKEDLRLISNKLSIDFNNRAENLNIDDFKKIFLEINKPI